MVVAYEAGMAFLSSGQFARQPPDLAAHKLLQWFFSLFGASGYYLPGFLLLAVLLAWHVAARDPWKLEATPLAGMLTESILLALPLLTLNRLFDGNLLAAGTNATEGVLDDLLLSVGAGIYEELLFRLILIALLMLLLKDIGGMRQSAAVAFAVIVSSLLFAAHHYAPIGSDDFQARDFAFRAVAGAYLAAVYVFRGFGIAVGCHAMYDVIVVTL